MGVHHESTKDDVVANGSPPQLLADGESIPCGPIDLEVGEAKFDTSQHQPSIMQQDQHLEELSLDGDNPRNPRNWSRSYRFIMTVLMSFMAFWTTLTPAVISPGISTAAQEFSASHEVTNLLVSMFVAVRPPGSAFLPRQHIVHSSFRSGKLSSR